MTTSREQFVERARDVADIGANPADPERRAAYIELVTGGLEDERTAAELATLSGCALVIRGLWRAFISHPLLGAPYRTGHAMSDLVAIAREVGAATPGLTRAPEPGDAVLVGGGPDGGGVEHVYTVVDIAPDAYADSGWLVTGLDGGQRDSDGFQVVRVRDHTISLGRDTAGGGSEPGAGTARLVRWVLNIEPILLRLGP